MIPAGGERSEAQAREGAMEGVLAVSGELGYREASVRAILEYSGGHRVQFYRHFKSKEDCFAQAYEAWMERLGVDLLEAALAVPGWRAGVQAALVELFELVTARPDVARALFVEAQVAGGRVAAEREEALERLAGAVDSARGELDPDEAPPEAAGAFVVGGIESCLCEALGAGDPERVWDALPELMRFAVGAYFGPQRAEAAFEEASALLERRRAGQAAGGAG